MKTTLLYFFGLLASASFAQFPINHYFGTTEPTLPTQGLSQRTYTAVTSSATLDHSPAGANASWNFTTLSGVGTITYLNTTPTPAEITAYPGTTMVTNSTFAGGLPTQNTLYTVMDQAIAGMSSVSGGFDLKYTNTAVMGTFPLSYGYSNTDAIGGTYIYDEYSGTFTGDIVTTVDAYGTLTLNDYGWGDGPMTETVTRLKTVQNITLNYGVIPNVGTATITTYYYYRDLAEDNFPYFTSTTMSISVPLLSLNETVTNYEAATPVLLATPEINKMNVSLAPNPVGNVLSIQADVAVNSVTITDANGRVIMTAKPIDGRADLSGLSSGVYFARINTDSGSVTKKIVKN